jgi:adenosylcobinamide kinase/adenosylcobinamide-phosphate guanylyltransferase
MNRTILIIGGCRSGKSRHALELGKKMEGIQKTFLATCVPRDDEMHQRVAKHQKDRSPQWKTVETPVNLAEAVTDHSPAASVIIVDCLTLWMSNLLMETEDEKVILEKIKQLTLALGAAESSIILVSNEVGTGIVPENRLARKFRDLTGALNQAIAECVDKVIWMVAGIPVVIKGEERAF